MINIMRTSIPFKVDTCAETNLICEKLWNKCVQKVQNNQNKERNKTLKSINSKAIDHASMPVVPFTVKKKTVNAEIFVTQDKTLPILGLQTAIELGLIKTGQNATKQLISNDRNTKTDRSQYKSDRCRWKHPPWRYAFGKQCYKCLKKNHFIQM